MSTGSNFENKIRDWHKGIDCYTFKFPDKKSSGSTQKAICDRVTISNNGVYWFECKTTKNKISFSFSLIKIHQWYMLSKVNKYYDNYGCFVIQDGCNNVYIISVDELLRIKGNRKSIKFSELKDDYLMTKKDFIGWFDWNALIFAHFWTFFTVLCVLIVYQYT